MNFFDMLVSKSINGGGGGSGTSNYNDLSNKPSINSVTLTGNKTASALGLQPEITGDVKISSDNVDDTDATNLFVTSGEKSTWSGKQDALTFDDAPTENSNNPVKSGGIYTALSGKQATLTFDDSPTSGSSNPVKSGGVYTALGNKQDTVTFDGTYSASANKAATVSTVTNAVNALDVTGGSVAASKTLASWSETDGKVSVTTQDIAITGSQAVLTGYSIAQSKQSIAATDTATEAFGKVEQRVQTNESNISSIQEEQVVQNREIATLREITNCKLYGYRIDKQDTNPDTRVTYLYDAVGMTPAYMDFSGGSFNYGSWADIWFIAKNRPVALKYDGTVDYELSHTDFAKKIDGETASDVSDSTYGGNFMSEIPLVYVKRWEDARYNYVVFCETKPNDDYLAQAHTNANGTVNPYIYLPMFKGSIDANNKLRSLMGTIPNGNTTAANEVTYVENCGNGWQLWDKAKIDLVMDLIVLITKSTNCRGKIGNGDCQTYNTSDTRKDSKNNGANGKMMSGYEVGDATRSANAQFYGSEGTDSTNYGKHHMIAFYIEDLWANRWDRCLGFNLVDNVYKVKMTPPYALDSDSTYQTLSVTPPSSTEGWLKNVSSGVYGDVPTEVGASNVSGFANYFYKNASGARLSLFGGAASSGLTVGRCWRLYDGATGSGWAIGGSPCYNAL